MKTSNIESMGWSGTFLRRWALGVGCSMLCLSALADLTVTTTPGYVFAPNERPTTSTLNRLGNPTISISGTVGGTNAGIAAGSINGALLSDTVVDGRTVEFTNSSPRAIQVKASGIASNELAAGAAAIGKIGHGAVTRTNLAANSVDSTNIIAQTIIASDLSTNIFGDMATKSTPIPADFVVLVDSADTNNTKKVTISSLLTGNSNRFTSAATTIATGKIIDTAHTFAARPGRLRLVLVCETADAGYAVGDEVEAGQDAAASSGDTPVFMVGANSTNVFALCSSTTLRSLNKSTGAADTLTAGSWKAKIYAEP